MHWKTWVAAICVSTSLSAQPAVAGEVEVGLAALNNGDYVTAAQVLYPLAKKGDAVAQNSLGLMYFGGLGVPQDYAEAARFYELSAKQGNDSGQLNLGRMYCIDKGRRVDELKAEKWFTLSAEHGNSEARMELGSLYRFGCDFTIADLEAWGNGEAEAAANLPVRLERNKKRDRLLAHMWFNLAAAGFSTLNIVNRDKAIEARDEVAKEMTNEEIAESQGLATKWIEIHDLPIAKTQPEFY